MSEASSGKLLESAIAAWNRGDHDAYMELYHDDVVLHTARGELRGAASVRAMYDDVWAAYQSRLEIDDLIADDPRVACRYRWIASDKSSSKSFSVPGITILHFDSGQCVERWDLEGRPEKHA
ncbi:MAG: nuclear transport factor 2 family protein [Candidatus Limnocylindria bacterium]